jgi:benzoyl-CoA reductase/2-hydroxyglutaryl-CoA dehydratase subunit BcrC/BadD/HgdB
MEAIKDLQRHLAARPAALAQARDQGSKVIGYYPGGFFPEELALAAGAIPIGLVRGGEEAAVALSGDYICRWIDPFCRAQIGYGISGSDPWYGGLDLLVIPITDNHVRAVADVLAYQTDLNVFPFGVPHMKEPSTLRYFRHGLNRLKGEIEAVTGVQITDDRLTAAISLCNRERKAWRRLYEHRQASGTAIASRDFILLQHGAQMADKQFMVELLERIDTVLTAQAGTTSATCRLLLTGSTLAWGDTLVTDLIENAGGTVVAEVFDEGLRWCYGDVSLEVDRLEALADAYFTRRVCPAWFRPGGERHDFLIEQAKRFQVDAVVWYHLMFRESFKTESFYFPAILKKRTGLPMLVVESDYEPVEAGNIGTRIETFLQNLKT